MPTTGLRRHPNSILFRDAGFPNKSALNAEIPSLASLKSSGMCPASISDVVINVCLLA